MIRTASPSSPFPGNNIVAALAPVALGDGHEAPIDWLAIERMLAAMPLMTADYGVCRLELENARKYLQRGEPGAAAYEIRLLLGRLARLGLIQVQPPKDKSDDR